MHTPRVHLEMCPTPADPIISTNVDPNMTITSRRFMTTEQSPKVSDQPTDLSDLMNSKEKKKEKANSGVGGIKILDPVHLALLDMKNNAI